MSQINLEGVSSISIDNIEPNMIGSGIKEYVLWKGEDGKNIAIYDFSPNTKLPFLDSHDVFNEHVFVLEGVFSDGERNYPKGSLVTSPKGTAHYPQSVEEGCKVIVSFT